MQYERVGTTLQRLLRMSPSELAYRGWQEATKRFERVAVATDPHGQGVARLYRLFADDPSLDGIRACAENGDIDGAARQLQERFRVLGAHRFFAGAADERTAALVATRMPWVRHETLVTAEIVARRHFDVLGYGPLYFGDPTDWHLDPIANRRAPRRHWSRIDPLDTDQVGDSKVVWELNRHQWLLDLGQAYRFTADERYAERFACFLREWMQANPPGMGINWASSLEASFRLISWCWALFLFQGSKVLSASLFATMFEWIAVHAAHIERYLSYYFSPNTHLTGEALGLFYAGVLFPELKGAERWRALGARILTEQLERQVFADGVYFEQSTCYQRYTIEIYLHFLILSRRNGLSVSPAASERVRKMVDFLLAVRRPDGSMPQIGDADGGCLLPLVRRAADDYRGLFALAAAVFDSSDYAWAAQGMASEVFWLLGAGGRDAFDALPQAAPTKTPLSRLFVDGGYAVMRSAWDKQAHQLIVDTGPLGCSVSGGHGHADLLSIQLAAFGEAFLIDPGTYAYTADARWRDHFRGSAAHNSVTIDSVGQATPTGPFKWHERPRAKLRRWLTTPSFDLIDAEHEAYRGLPDPVTHRRRVFFSKPRYWLVVDDLDGVDEHRIDLHFQFAPMQVTLSTDGWTIARSPGGSECRLFALATVPLTSTLTEAQLDPIRGWVSPDYGQREAAPMLTHSVVARLPVRIVTFLLPVENSLVPSPVVVASLAYRRIDIVFEDRTESLLIDDDDITIVRVPNLVN
ncbi:MAG TPA: alginate lyase family protein [Burkholderiales bacterium]|nr:alginate lyase family protein [Burkholderiales bacterium]